MKLAFVSGVAVAVAEIPSYQEWRAMYGKNGEDREHIYNATVETIKALNAEGGAVFDVNEHSDLTTEEWKVVRGIRAWRGSLKAGVDPEDGRADQCNFEDAESTGVLSSEQVEALDSGDIDWVKDGAVTPVKDQGSSGTCGYFSSICVVEGANVVQGGNELVSLSEQENIDCCTPGNGGCNGWPGQEIAWYSKNGGVMAKTEQSYPYRGSSQIPKPDGTPCKSSSGTPTKATTSGKLCVANDPAVITAHLKTMGPAVWMIDATCLQSYSRGVISSARCAGSGGTWPHYNGIDHATTIVGAGTDNGVAYWKVKNSWGRSWGESGYYRVKQDEVGSSKPNLHAIGAIFATVSSSVQV